MAAPLSVSKCLGDAVDQGRLSREAADEALRVLNDVMGRRPGVLTGEALAETAERLQRDAALRRRQAALQAKADHQADADAASHSTSYYNGTAALFSRDVRDKVFFGSAEANATVHRRVMHAKIAVAVEHFTSKRLGLSQDIVGPRDWVRELYGEGTGNGVAAAAARGFKEAAEYGRRTFNAAGGDIPEKSNWHLPNPELVPENLRRIGQSKYEEFMHRALDEGRLRIWDYQADEAVSPLKAAEIISQAFARSESNGLVDFVPGQRGGTKLANSRGDHRVFEWTSPDAWLEANAFFGRGDEGIFDALVGHLEGLARDIGLVERFGPNASAGMQLAIDRAVKMGASATERKRLERLREFIAGDTMSPVRPWLAAAGSGLRHYLTGTRLGSATLTSVTDFETVRLTAAWNGLEVTKILSNYTQHLNPMNAEGRIEAMQAGLTADGLARRMRAAQRTMMEEIGQTLPARYSDTMLRASGLNIHTNALKLGFEEEFLTALGRQASRAWGDMDDTVLRGALERYGTTPEQWDLIRKIGLEDGGTGPRIVPSKLVEEGGPAGLEAAKSVLRMIDNERGFAVLEPGVTERSYLLGGTQPGTWAGEGLRTVLLFKTFPVTMMMRHLMRGWGAGDGRYISAAGGAYLARMGVGLTILGAIALQMQEVRKGKDPRPMDDWKFWGAAFMQGGAAGIFGDFLYGSVSRSGLSFTAATAGPAIGLADDIARLFGMNITALAEEKDVNLGRATARFVRNNAPGGSLWYAHLGLNRLAFDALQEQLDPEANRSWARTIDRARRETRQEYWWRPGEAGPERAPNLGAAMGTLHP